MTSNSSRSARLARNFWWLGALVLLLMFNVLLLGSALLLPRVLWQFDIDGTRRDLDVGLKLALFSGNLGFGVVTFLSSLLAFFVLNRPCHARRFKIWLLSMVGILFWGALLKTLWRFQANPDLRPDLPPAYSIDIAHLLFFGLPLLWSLSLIPIALKWQEPHDSEAF